MKRSIRDYLLTLFLAILVFAVVAFFLIRAAETLMGDVVEKIGSEEPVQAEQEKEPEPETTPVQTGGETPDPQAEVTLSFLFMLIDEKERADSIFLIGINATKKKATVSLIPSNTVVPEGTKKYNLGDLYASRNMNFFKDFIAQETGVMPDYYMAMSMSGFSNMVDFIGGVNYQVPEDMSSYDAERKLKVDLRAGNQTLTGDQAVQLFSYRGFQDGDTQQQKSKLGFMQNFCMAYLKSEKLAHAKSIRYNVAYHTVTDFEEKDLNQWGDVIFRFSSFSQEYARIPGAPTSAGFYAISTSRAKSLFENYR